MSDLPKLELDITGEPRVFMHEMPKGAPEAVTTLWDLCDCKHVDWNYAESRPGHNPHRRLFMIMANHAGNYQHGVVTMHGVPAVVACGCMTFVRGTESLRGDAVHPLYRGMGLHQLLIEARIRHAKHRADGRKRKVTAQTDDVVAGHNFIRAGMRYTGPGKEAAFRFTHELPHTEEPPELPLWPKSMTDVIAMDDTARGEG